MQMGLKFYSRLILDQWEVCMVLMSFNIKKNFYKTMIRMLNRYVRPEMKHSLFMSNAYFENKRIRRERWTVTISLNIDFFFSSTIYISSSIREKNRVRVGEVFPSSIILKTGFFFISTLLFLLNRNGIQC